MQKNNFYKSIRKWKKENLSLNKRLIILFPYFIGASLFIVFPLIILIIKSSTPIKGEDNLFLLRQKSTWEVMLRSVYLGLISSVISLLISFPFSYIVSRSNSKSFRMMSISLMISPLFVFSVSKVFGLRILLLKIFDSPEEIDNEFIMILGMVYLYMPFMIIPLYSVLQYMPKSLLESSNDMGYGKFKTILKVVIPYSTKAIFSGIAVVFMLSATTLVISSSLLGHSPSSVPQKVKSIGSVIDQLAVSMRQKKLATAYGSTLALATIAVMISVYGIIYFVPQLIRKIRGGVNV